jgi:hypothetical protein
MNMDSLVNINKNFSKKDNVALSYILKKTTKIVTVVLMLADGFDENSVFKKELQRTSISLLKEVSKSDLFFFSRKKVLIFFQELSTLLEICSSAGYISKMNVDVILSEINSLLAFVHRIDWSEGRRFFENDFFNDNVPVDLFKEEKTSSFGQHFDNRQKTDTGFSQKPTTEQHGVFNRAEDKRDTATNGHVKYKERIQEIQKDRRATILGLLQKKDRVTVKDVANIIKDCSDKTIQRELLALVKQGVLVKEGERRWSTYRLA